MSANNTEATLVSFYLDDNNILTFIDYALQMNTTRFIVERRDDNQEWRVTIDNIQNGIRIKALQRLMSDDNTPEIITDVS